MPERYQKREIIAKDSSKKKRYYPSRPGRERDRKTHGTLRRDPAVPELALTSE
jgi:hypothetical protein